MAPYSALFVTGLALVLSLGWGSASILPTTQHVLTSGTQSNSAKKELEIVHRELAKAEIIPTVIDNFIPSLLVEAHWGNKHASLGNTLKPKYLEDKPKIFLHDPLKHHHKKHHKKATSKCSTQNRKPNPAPASTYVLALTDPDAPSRDDPKWSEFCHWIAISPYWKNANTGDSNSQDENEDCSELETLRPTPDREIDLLDEIIEYKPPAPPEKTGKHRYVLLAFVPANGTTERIYPSKPADRKHWGYEVDDEAFEEEEDEHWWNFIGGGKKKKGKENKNTPGVRRWAKENGLVAVGANFIYAKHE